MPPIRKTLGSWPTWPMAHMAMAHITMAPMAMPPMAMAPMAMAHMAHGHGPHDSGEEVVSAMKWLRKGGGWSVQLIQTPPPSPLRIPLEPEPLKSLCKDSSETLQRLSSIHSLLL